MTPHATRTMLQKNYITEYNHSIKPSSPDESFTRLVLITGVGYLSTLLAVFFMVSDKVPQPYMDEVFHVQQARSYFVGNFTQWNPKITTPPGLYLTTLGVLKPFSELYAFGEEDSVKICPTLMLRFINILFALANPYVMYCILSRDLPSKLRVNCLVSSLSLATLPPLFFFNFLYYTDSGSLFFILLMYYYHCNNQEWLASLFGAISLLYRQTNIVWIFFLASQTSLKILSRNLDRGKKKPSHWERLRAVAIPTINQVLMTCGGYVILGFLFLNFVAINGGIVLGDRSAHVSVFHAPQMMYFGLFVLIFGFPWVVTLDNVRSFINVAFENKLRTIFITSAMVGTILTTCHVHPYLLADNRHYTFYIWRRVLGCPTSLASRPIVLVPIYAFSWYGFVSSLDKKETVWKALFMFCIAVSIIPQKLLELRYFIVPFVVWRLNLSSQSQIQLLLEFAINCFVNVLTIYLFLYKTFKWPHAPSEIQRFMW